MMATGKLLKKNANVQGLLNDKDALRELVQIEIQKVINGEFEEHIARGRYERKEGAGTHRNGFKPRTLTTRVGKIYLRIPQARDGSFSPSVYEKYQRVEKALFLTLVETYRLGVSTRKIKTITEELCGDIIPKSTISAWCSSLDDELNEFRERPLDTEYPYVVVDAQVKRVRVSRKVVSESVLVAEGISSTGYREVIGVAVGNSESHQTWKDFFLSLRKRGLKGVNTIVSDNHAGLVSAALMCFQGSQWQRCQFHFGRNARGYLPRKMHSEMHRRLKEIWNANTRETADYLINKMLQDYSHRAKFCDWLEENIEDCLAVLELPPEHRRRLRTTNAVERMHEEIKRRTQPIRIFPNRNSVLRMVTALWQDIHEKWLTGRKYLDMDVINEWERERELVNESETTNGVNGNSQKI